jgi:hypothetical protein
LVSATIHFLNATGKHQEQENQQHQAQTTTGVVTPSSAVWPCWYDAQQHQEKQNQNDIEQH